VNDNAPPNSEPPTRRAAQKRAKTAIAVVFSAFMLMNYWLAFLTDRGMDFQMFYSAAQMVRHGHGGDLYNLGAQKSFQAEYIGRVGLVFNYPAATCLPYLPSTFLSLQGGFLVWTAFSMSLLAVCTFLLNRSESVFRDTHWAFLFAFLFLPVHILFLQGQVDTLVLLAYVLSFLAFKAKKDFISGLALALGMVKFHLVLPAVALLLIRNQKRSMLGFAAGLFIFLVLCFAIGGRGFVTAYPSLLLHLKDIPSAGYAPAAMANLHGLLFVLFRREPSFWIVFAVSVGVFTWTAFAWRKDGRGFASMVVMAVLTSYHLNPHDLVLLIVPLAIAIARIRWLSTEGILVLIVALPVLPKILLSLHAFAYLSIPITALWYLWTRRTSKEGPCTTLPIPVELTKEA
jgi:hypothetical protein